MNEQTYHLKCPKCGCGEGTIRTFENVPITRDVVWSDDGSHLVMSAPDVDWESSSGEVFECEGCFFAWEIPAELLATADYN